MTRLSIIFAIALTTACSSKSDDPSDPHRKATAEECQHAYDHLAEIDAAAHNSTKAEELKLQQGNLEHCPKTTTKGGIDCMLALQKHDMTATADCAMRK